ncbi:type I-E CRISPR-associated endoribonuclease Cas2 [Corynebacterium sp. sy017]|uniref:type I-E CRISPR-associated endoribonuclease Cas2e n=1 Tax=unclassified Corynebacterium TaxID=2624378 RepID=UPI0011859CA9|nr:MULTISPECIES: type I-E CRISPR-associated endoribonuclease Cas2e [unclassified Corynebacterium]MBP3088475.1 type I-E CRISPR-associated endoribonuclease Cas2 [Corynebacterium sp. sy017]TSD91783.1 type I-E CRISPR-associated endoribonuclease Cas2 [Corynebacterium sp. SY003]
MFAVIKCSAIPEHLSGYISRFFSEIDPGLYIGVTSRAVVERLWERCNTATIEGTLILITPRHDSEQGFEVRSTGNQRRPIFDFDGIQLAQRTYSTRHNVNVSNITNETSGNGDDDLNLDLFSHENSTCEL